VAREATAAVTGAATGMAVGGLAGLLLATAALAIPGVGPVLVAGPALTLLGGTTLGIVAGGLIGGLTRRGIPEDDAHFYAEGLRRGATLVTVNAKSDELATRAADILKRHGAVDLDELSAKWKKQGWNGRFDEKAPAAPARSGASNEQMAAAAPDRSAASHEQMAAAAPAASNEPRASDAAASVGGVRVYEIFIEAPGYGGAERRVQKRPYEGADRRMAA
jgi:hypothetical protein